MPLEINEIPVEIAVGEPGPGEDSANSAAAPTAQADDGPSFSISQIVKQCAANVLSALERRNER